jgi:hypothetical protein
MPRVKVSEDILVSLPPIRHRCLYKDITFGLIVKRKQLIWIISNEMDIDIIILGFVQMVTQQNDSDLCCVGRDPYRALR